MSVRKIMQRGPFKIIATFSKCFKLITKPYVEFVFEMLLQIAKQAWAKMCARLHAIKNWITYQDISLKFQPL